MNNRWHEKRRGFKSANKFLHLNELFHLTAKEWAELLDELDSLTPELREKVVWGRDDEYGRGYE